MNNDVPTKDYLGMPVARPKISDKYVAALKPEWKKGLAAFADETQALGGGLVGMAGQAATSILPEVARPYAEAVRDWGLKTYTENMEESTAGWQAPNVARIEDINLTDEGGAERLGDWAAYQGTKGLATLAGLALTGGVGGAVAKAATKQGVKKIAKNFANRNLSDRAKKTLETEATKALRIAGKPVTPKAIAGVGENAAAEVSRNVTRGAVAGAGLGAFGLEGGGAFGEQVTQDEVAPQDALLPSIGVGAINAALELVAPISVAKKLGLGSWVNKGLAKQIKADPELAKKATTLAGKIKKYSGKAVKGAATTAAQEGITEGVQELVQIAGSRIARDADLLAELSEEDRSQIMNAAAAGGLTGGLFGGAAGPFTQTPQTISPQQETEVATAEAAAAQAAAEEAGTAGTGAIPLAGPPATGAPPAPEPGPGPEGGAPGGGVAGPGGGACSRGCSRTRGRARFQNVGRSSGTDLGRNSAAVPEPARGVFGAARTVYPRNYRSPDRCRSGTRR